MEKLVIHGGKTLHGNVRVSSAKNAVLPIIVATLLPETPASIVDAPNLDDVFTICSVLESLGVKVKKEDNVLTFDSSLLNKTEASYELMSKMRASFLIMGPLLAKMGHAKIALPGGCMIGSRPIDLHLKAFEAMGAEINIGNGFVEQQLRGGLSLKMQQKNRKSSILLHSSIPWVPTSKVRGLISSVLKASRNWRAFPIQ